MTEKELNDAFDWLLLFMEGYRPELVAMARGRLALGVFLYPEGPLYSKTQNQLAGEIAEEIADAIVYSARKLDTSRDVV